MGFCLTRSLQGCKGFLKRIWSFIKRGLSAPIGLLSQIVIVSAPIFFSLIIIGLFDNEITAKLLVLPEWGVVAFSLMVVSTTRSLQLARHGKIKIGDLEAGVAFNFLVALTAMLAFVFSFLHGQEYLVFESDKESLGPLELLGWVNMTVFIASVLMYIAMHVRISILQSNGHLDKID